MSRQPEEKISNHAITIGTDDSRAVALEHYKALRVEIIERLKMRDQVLLAYMGAIAALAAFTGGDISKLRTFHTGLLLLIPFLSVGVAACVTQHQDTIIAFNQYIVHELLPQMSNPVLRIYDSSRAAHQHTPNSLDTRFITQAVVIVGPPTLMILASLFKSERLDINANPGAMAVGTCATGYALYRLLQSRKYRIKIHNEFYVGDTHER